MPNVQIPGYGVVSFPDNMSQADINSAAKRLYEQAKARPAGGMLSAHGVERAEKQRRQARTEGVAEALPAVGGIIGGTIPRFIPGVNMVPGSNIAGATLLGGAGEAIRQGITPAPFDPGKIAQEAGIQGGLEAAGGVVGKVASAAAKPLMSYAARTTPEAAKTLLREGVAVSRGGFEKVNNLVRMSREQADKLARAGARIAGGRITFRPNAVAQEARRELFGKVGRQAVQREDRKFYQTMIDRFMRDHPGPLSVDDLLNIRRTSDREAKPIFDALKKAGKGQGAVPTAAQVRKAHFHKAVADAARRRLNRIPQVAEQNAMTSELAAAREAVGKTINRGGGGMRAQMAGSFFPMAAGGTIGALAGHGGLGSALGAATGMGIAAGAHSPYAVSQMARLLTSPAPAAATATGGRLLELLLSNRPEPEKEER